MVDLGNGTRDTISVRLIWYMTGLMLGSERRSPYLFSGLLASRLTIFTCKSFILDSGLFLTPP
jgi:hypothetical protein